MSDQDKLYARQPPAPGTGGLSEPEVKTLIQEELKKNPAAPGGGLSREDVQQIADAAAKAAREGKEFSLKEFHSRALAIGSVGLDVLREALS